MLTFSKLEERSRTKELGLIGVSVTLHTSPLIKFLLRTKFRTANSSNVRIYYLYRDDSLCMNNVNSRITCKKSFGHR